MSLCLKASFGEILPIHMHVLYSNFCYLYHCYCIFIGHDLKAFVREGRKHIRYCITLGTKGRGYDPVPVEYTGVPFIEAGTYVMECHLGMDTGIWNKRRYAARRDRIEVVNLCLFN